MSIGSQFGSNFTPDSLSVSNLFAQKNQSPKEEEKVRSLESMKEMDAQIPNDLISNDNVDEEEKLIS